VGSYFNWSSGKDSVLALYKVLEDPSISISKLVTTVNGEVDRVSMHGLRISLLKMQARSVGIPLQMVALNGNISMEAYDRTMRTLMSDLKGQGYTKAFFGDIFLEDLRKYREDRLAEVGIKVVFPLWKGDTKKLMAEFLDAGFKAITVCVNAKYLDPSFCGRKVDMDFLNELPEGVDACGENGEFHTFVYDGPIFQFPVDFTIGEIVKKRYGPSKDGDDCFSKEDLVWDNEFWFCDLLPTES
tara:strand:+ start:115122 stop:115847 length:726 start_codon:yes stop_codon:yes gene_type:complete